MKLFKKEMKKMFSSNVKPRIVSTGRKVGTSFRIKDQIKMNTNMILYIAMSALRNNATKTTLVKPEEGSVKGL